MSIFYSCYLLLFIIIVLYFIEIAAFVDYKIVIRDKTCLYYIRYTSVSPRKCLSQGGRGAGRAAAI